MDIEEIGDTGFAIATTTLEERMQAKKEAMAIVARVLETFGTNVEEADARAKAGDTNLRKSDNPILTWLEESMGFQLVTVGLIDARHFCEEDLVKAYEMMRDVVQLTVVATIMAQEAIADGTTS